MDGAFFSADTYAAIVEQAVALDRSPAARIRSLVRRIVEDPARPRGVESLADHAAMSERSLQRWFRRATGETPARFVERERVRLAQRLLAETGLSIKSIAVRCGFGSEERLRRAFHRRLGRGPRDYARTLTPSPPTACRPSCTAPMSSSRDRIAAAR